MADDHLSDISSDEDDDIFYDAMEPSTSDEEPVTEDEIGESDDDEDDDDNYALADEEFETDDEYQEGLGENFNPTDYYELQQPVHQLFPRYHSHGVKARVVFRNMENLPDAGSISHGLEPIFDDILRNLLNMVPGAFNDLVGVEVSHPNLHRSILVPFKWRQDVNGKTIAIWIEKVLQSHDDINLNELGIKMVVIHHPAGAGIHNPLRSNWKEWYEKHSGGHGGFLIKVKNNNDKWCLPRALVVARARLHPKEYNWENVRKGDKWGNQRNQAIELMQLAGLEGHKGPCGMEELKKLQDAMPDFQIKVYSKEYCHMMIFRGPDNKDDQHVLQIYHHDDHYTVISSICGFMENSYYCNYCDKCYNNLEDHYQCAKICPCCYTRSDACVEDQVTKTYCEKCNRFFRNQHCFDRHNVKQQVTKLGKRKRAEVSICDRIKCCNDCGVLVNDKRTTKHDHICGYFDCRVCGEYVELEGHKCYIRPLGKDEDGDGEEKLPEKVRYVFFDFEASQEEFVKEMPYGPMFEHKTNLCVAHICCSDCLDNKELGNCPRCQEGRKIFVGETCQNDFCQWLFMSADSLKKTKTIAIVHNMKGYDGQFILQYLHDQALIPTIVPKGLEIMSIAIGKTKIIDSLNFMPSRLADLPKTFGINEMKKGYFPHLFNKAANWEYEEPLPESSEYSLASLKPEDQTKFYEWYRKEAAAKKVFNFRKEIVEYCESDVDILHRCCLAFHKVFLESTGLDPFTESLTIAAACNKVYRTLFLKKQTIGIVPHGGYRLKDKYSNIAIKWIKWIEHTKGIRIQNATNGGEASVLSYKVDGLHGKTIYEFNGCWWHGCPRCMKRDQQMTPDRVTTVEKAFLRTKDRKAELEGQGYTVVEKWECDLNRELKENVEMSDFFDGVELMEPMNPREAFYSGRTNATKLYHKCGPGEKIKYIDMVSLYPYVCKYGMFPLGHPGVILEDFESINTNSKPYKGLIKATVVPPTDLPHPLLPMHCNGKLLFSLCSTCTKEQQKEQCQHTDEERAITGAWCHPELYKAIDLGYEVVKVHEVYDYKEWEQYDPATQTGGLFSDYINKFLKLKQEADGWPSWCQTDADKDWYIDDYFDHEGIRLDKAKIAKNPGFRALAKLMMNSFWGKFGQCNNMAQTSYFRDPEPFCNLVFDPTNTISAVNFVNNHLVTVTHSQEEDFVQVAGNTNVVIAAFTTAQARLKLYTCIEQLQERVLYFDTDSVIYLSTQNQWEPEIGSYLGMMSNELKDYGPGAYITEFVSGGPKNYAYKVRKFDETGRASVECKCKVRGFSLLSFTQNQLNFANMRRMVKAFVKSGCQEEFTIVYNKISRLPIYRNVVTMPQPKRYRVVYDKRTVKRDFTTLPYGFVSNLDVLISLM